MKPIYILRILFAIIAAPLYIPLALIATLLLAVLQWIDLCYNIIEGIIYGK